MLYARSYRGDCTAFVELTTSMLFPVECGYAAHRAEQPPLFPGLLGSWFCRMSLRNSKVPKVVRDLVDSQRALSDVVSEDGSTTKQGEPAPARSTVPRRPAVVPLTKMDCRTVAPPP